MAFVAGKIARTSTRPMVTWIMGAGEDSASVANAVFALARSRLAIGALGTGVIAGIRKGTAGATVAGLGAARCVAGVGSALTSRWEVGIASPTIDCFCANSAA